MKQRCLFLIIAWIVIFMKAEGVNLIGKIVDNKDKQPLLGVYVALTPEDGETKYAVSGNMGEFSFNNLDEGKYTLFSRYLGYKNITKEITIEKEDVSLNLSMKSETVALDGVEKIATQARVEMKTDTVSMTANSYKTNEDASASDLIKKMPSIVVNNGTVQAQGEDVKKVLVNGKEFFGNDPNSALNNLPANVIERVEVYDDETEHAKLTGVSSGNTSKTMNIILKPESTQGIFGRLSGGVGYENKYTVGGNINIFDGDRRISIIGMSNNINVQNFSPQDLTGISSTSSNRGRSRRGRDDGSSNFMVSQQGGISTTNSTGLNYQDVLWKKVTVVGSYFFNQTINNNEETTLQDYFAEDQNYISKNKTHSINFNHRFNLKIDYKIDENNLIRFIPSLSVQKNEGISMLNSSLNNSGSPITTVDNESSSNLNAATSNNQLMYQHKFNKLGRVFVANAVANFSPNSGKSNLFASTGDYSSFTNVFDTTNQYSKLKTSDNTYGINISYSEPISKISTLNIGYGYSRELSSSNKLTYNYSPLDDAYINPDTALSNVIKNDFNTSKGNLGYQLNVGKIIASLNGTYQIDQIKNDQTFPYIGSANKKYTNVLPRAQIRYMISKTQRLSFNYNASVKNPSSGQLQNAVDNSNLLQLSTGNPDLDQQYGQNLSFKYFRMSDDKTSIFFGRIGANFANNYITSNSIYAANDTIINGIAITKGAYLTSPENVNGYKSFSSFIAFGRPLTFIKSNLNIHASASWTKTPNLINSLLNFGVTQNYMLGLIVSSNINENVDFTLGTTSQKNLAKNSFNDVSQTNYFSQKSTANINWTFGLNLLDNINISDLNLIVNASHQYNQGYDESVQKNTFLLNGGIGKKLMKRKAEISLMVYDLFNQNNTISQSSTDYYTQQQQSLTLQRYIMLTFSYKINKFKSGSEPVEENKHWGQVGFTPPPRS